MNRIQGIVVCVLTLFPLPAAAQTAISSTLQITLLPGYEHVPLKGIDSIVGQVAKKGDLTIQYEIGRVTQPGGLALGGDFVNLAERMPAAQRAWLKQHTIKGQPVSVAYSKQGTLVVSFSRLGVNFTAQTKTPEEITEVLLQALTLENRPKQKVKDPV